MIFTGFKRKANQFFFNKKAQRFEVNANRSTSAEIKNVLVLLTDATLKKEVSNDLQKILNISENQIDIVIFQKNKAKKDSNDGVFTPKDFGWFGKIKSQKLQHILTKKYDLLINYSKVDNIYSNLLLLQSEIAFRVGFAHLNSDFYDLTINCKLSEIKLFNIELKKYLSILKKI